MESNGSIAYAYFLLGQFELALPFYQEALKIKESNNFQKSGLHLGIASILLATGDYDKAIVHIKSELAECIENKDEYVQAESLWILADAHQRKENYTAALQYAIESLEVNDRRYKKNLGYANLIAAKASLELGQPERALGFTQDAFNMTMTERKPNIVLLSNIENEFGQVYQEMGQHGKAVLHYEKSLSITDKSGYRDLSKNTRLQLSRLYEEREDAKMAMYHYKKYMSLNDSLFNESKSRQLAELQTKYETERKEIENQSLRKSNQLIAARNRQYVIGGSILLALLVVLGIGVVQLRNIKSELAAQNKTIAKQNKKLTKLDRIKSNFFSNITHEFRTPLTLILEPVRQMLEENTEGPFKQKLSFVKNNSEKLLALVNQLLDMAKLESLKMGLDLQKGNFQETIQPIYQSFLILAEKKGIQLKMSGLNKMEDFILTK